MAELILILPGRDWGPEVMAYRREHLEREADPIIHGGGFLEQYDSYEQWLHHVADQRSLAAARPGLVPSTTWLAVCPENHKLVGLLDIRHWLNDFLRDYGGHVGYGVRPAERGKGYAGQILKLGLARCREMGLLQVLLAARSDNPASLRVIEKSGGVFEKERLHPAGGWMKLYWVNCCKSGGEHSEPE